VYDDRREGCHVARPLPNGAGARGSQLAPSLIAARHHDVRWRTLPLLANSIPIDLGYSRARTGCADRPGLSLFRSEEGEKGSRTPEGQPILRVSQVIKPRAGTDEPGIGAPMFLVDRN
jgi:hypothetical protein